MNPPDVVSEDARGWIARVLLPDGREWIMIYTRKGFARGGEYHKSGQHDLVVSGKLIWKIRPLTVKNPTYTVKTQLPGGIGYFKPYVVHMALADEDTLYVEWLDSFFEKTYDPDTRAIVEEKMRENTSSSSSG